MEISATLIDQDGLEYPLTGAMNVGRSADCSVTIDDPKVSRIHAVFRLEGGQFVVEDMGSSNGTRVNELKIDKSTPVYNGDSVCFEKHCFKLVISGGAEDMDATVVDSDATVVNTLAEVASAEPAPAGPAEAAAAETAAPSAVPDSLDDIDLPGSWVDDGTGEETRVLSMDDAAAMSGDEQSAGASVGERMSELAHLIVLDGAGVAGEVFELEPGGTDDPDVWELGRDADCELSIADASVSGRHAQLIHEGGRWRLVNLVSTNGIFVNGDKRLTAYLGDCDRIQLGEASVVFRAPLHSAAASGGVAGNNADASGGTATRGRSMTVIVGVLALLLAVGAWLLLA